MSFPGFGLVLFFGFVGFVFAFALVFGHPVFCVFLWSPTARDQLTDHATS